MKRMISMILVLATVFTLVTSVAVADLCSFGYKTIVCASNQERNCNAGSVDTKSGNTGKLYVRHYLYGDFGGVYTNYFRASESSTTRTGLVGGNWMAPDTANYVRSTSITRDKNWYTWGRGNTDYGLTYITISGYSNPDA
jgi:hypothetical protein